MWWECSECGFQVSRAHRPITCEECGVASPVFVRAEAHLETPGDHGWRDYWLERGVQSGQPIGLGDAV